MVNNQQVCAGSIISERTVMTAAHCVRGFQASQMQIITGTNNLVPPFPKNSRRIKVAWTKYHPNYAPNIQHNDIAVIRLQCAVPFTGPNQIGDIVPACLPPAGTEFTGRSNCILIGWGQLSKYGQSVPRLREVKLPIQTPYTCTKKYGGSFVPKTMICAGDQSASGCHGDSGGPVICTQGSTNYVAGVVSHGDNYSCKVNGVYTKVNAFLSCNQCGKVLSSRVVKGYESKNYYPFMVALTVNGGLTCGGSLISERTVLTAAHCVYGMNARMFQVVTGTNDLRNRGKNSRLVGVAWFKYHESFDHEMLTYDIAVMRLKCSVPFTDPKQPGDLMPACLTPVGKEFVGSQNCRLIGWGKTSTYASTVTKLREVSLPINSAYTCQLLYGNTFNGQKQICGGVKHGVTSCNGDSGGPLLCKEGTTTYLAGLVSYGTRLGCIYPGAFTKVNAYLSWINKYK
ncbi:hypothetical protein SNEBB_010639 [Seison nebaliae]|nr:hypothetical protein SNEBB_010639 [Seison nebaliae]